MEELAVEALEVTLAPETLDFYKQAADYFSQSLTLELSHFYLSCFIAGLLVVLIFSVSFK